MIRRQSSGVANKAGRESPVSRQAGLSRGWRLDGGWIISTVYFRPGLLGGLFTLILLECCRISPLMKHGCPVELPPT